MYANPFINQSVNHYFFMRLKVDQTAGQLSLQYDNNNNSTLILLMFTRRRSN